MLIAAAEEVAKFAEERGIHEEYIIPKMTEWEVYAREAAAVAATASAQRVARTPKSYKEELEHAREIIGRNIRLVELLMKEEVIA